jgi:hypothetical protein
MMPAMDAVPMSRAALVLLVAVVLAGGVVLGSALTALVSPGASQNQSQSPIPSPRPSPGSSAASLPSSDVSGEDIARLPRYPGSVRTEHEVTLDDRFRLTVVEYFADDELDAVRAFYQDVIDRHGWERADIAYAGGEWTYLLVDGSTEALVELEVTRGFVEIDIQVSEETDAAPPDPTPTPRATPRPATPPPPPPAPPGNDDDDDDDDRDDDDTDDDGGDSDD